MYSIYLSRRAEKFLNKLDKHISERIKKRLKRLSKNPIPADSKFIKRDRTGDRIFRYRIGDYRALYKVKENKKTVLVVKIDKRPRVYDR